MMPDRLEGDRIGRGNGTDRLVTVTKEVANQEAELSRITRHVQRKLLGARTRAGGKAAVVAFGDNRGINSLIPAVYPGLDGERSSSGVGAPSERHVVDVLHQAVCGCVAEPRRRVRV